MDVFGWVGWGIAVILGVLRILQYRKDKPIIKIEKVSYLKHKKFEELNPREYSQKLLRGEFNDGSLNYEIRELVVNITNDGHRDAFFRGIFPAYVQKGRNSYSPKVINFNPDKYAPRVIIVDGKAAIRIKGRMYK